MIKTFIFVEDGSVDIDELEEALGSETKVIVYRQGAIQPKIEQPELPISTYKDNSYKETKKVLEEILFYKMSKKLRKRLEKLYDDFYCD